MPWSANLIIPTITALKYAGLTQGCEQRRRTMAILMRSHAIILAEGIDKIGCTAITTFLSNYR